MNTPGFDPLWLYKQREKEFLDEARRHRLVQEALAAGMQKPRRPSNLLLLAGKGLVALGTRLVERYGVQPCEEAALGQQGFNLMI